jgi:hypothetical protein
MMAITTNSSISVNALCLADLNCRDIPAMRAAWVDIGLINKYHDLKLCQGSIMTAVSVCIGIIGGRIYSKTSPLSVAKIRDTSAF